jgi:hypothetical protein
VLEVFSPSGRLEASRNLPPGTTELSVSLGSGLHLVRWRDKSTVREQAFVVP